MQCVQMKIHRTRIKHATELCQYNKSYQLSEKQKPGNVSNRWIWHPENIKANIIQSQQTVIVKDKELWQ